MPAERDQAQTSLGWRLAAVAFAAIFVVFSAIAVLRTHGHEEATDFSRVGGQTRVETAIEASNFWAAPESVVVLPMQTDPTALAAATTCAIENSAPILFWSPRAARADRLEERLRVMAAGRSDLRIIALGTDETANLRLGGIGTVEGSCPSGPSTAADQIRVLPDQLQDPLLGEASSVLSEVVPNSSHQLPEVVVFAATRTPSDMPGLAVALALAGHLSANAGDDGVGLVVVPRYIESDPALRDALTSQHDVIDQGVVIGGPLRISDQVKSALRQLLPQAPGDLSPWRTLTQDTWALILAVVALFAATTTKVLSDDPVRRERIAVWFQRSAARVSRSPDEQKSIHRLVVTHPGVLGRSRARIQRRERRRRRRKSPMGSRSPKILRSAFSRVEKRIRSRQD